MTGEDVERIGDEWVATCDHGHEGVWTIHRATEYAARRSLRAHRGDWNQCRIDADAARREARQGTDETEDA